MRESIKDGEVRESENGVALVMGVWQDGNSIQIISERNFKTSVNDKDGSVRQHSSVGSGD